jgi:hypothetical protein
MQLIFILLNVFSHFLQKSVGTYYYFYWLVLVLLISVVTLLWAGQSRTLVLIPGIDRNFCHPPSILTQLWSSPSLLYNGFGFGEGE